MRGNIGKPGAGVLPIRGHSNVQGQRTVGITEKPDLVPNDKLKELYDFEPPKDKGLNCTEAAEAVIEGMRHFYSRAMQLKAVGGKPELVDASLLEAVKIAEKIAPYRHHKLAAIKLNKDPVEPRFRKGASMEELRAEMQRHLEILAPVLDLEALVAPFAQQCALFFAPFPGTTSG